MATLSAAYTTPSRRFAGRFCAVTGGAGGIGEGCARQLAAEGGRVAVFDILTAQGEGLVRELNSGVAPGAPPVAVFVHCDISDEAAVPAAFERARLALGGAEGGAWDVLVCMAANFVYKEVHEATHKDWDRALSVNVRGTATTIKAVIPGMRAAGKGAVVLTSSITGNTAFPGFVPYSATKAALQQMTRDIALDNGSYGIRVNCAAPGPIFTLGGTVAHARQQGQDVAELCAGLSADVALRRMGTIREMAQAVAFLASEDAGYISGTTVHVDGGFFRK
jgi:NAD(P)-dependent dehydrogenase (short-subunit alcohol dehydrogenase family)